jgi:hypothetical protein
MEARLVWVRVQVVPCDLRSRIFYFLLRDFVWSTFKSTYVAVPPLLIGAERKL